MSELRKIEGSRAKESKRKKKKGEENIEKEREDTDGPSGRSDG